MSKGRDGHAIYSRTPIKEAKNVLRENVIGENRMLLIIIINPGKVREKISCKVLSKLLSNSVKKKE